MCSETKIFSISKTLLKLNSKKNYNNNSFSFEFSVNHGRKVIPINMNSKNSESATLVPRKNNKKMFENAKI